MAAFPHILLFLAALFFASSSSVLTQNNTQLIYQTCKQTNYSDLCVSSLESDPRSSTPDLSIYAKIIVELSLSNATDTYSYTYKLSSNQTMDDEILKMCLYDCLQVYDIGINNLRQSLIYLDLKEYIQVIRLLGVAQEQGEQCDQFFEKPPVPKSPSPLTHRNEVFEQLCSIAIVIVKLLGWFFFF